MKTFTRAIAGLALAGTSTLTPSIHAQTAAAKVPSEQADPQDHQAHHPAEPAQPATPPATKVNAMRNTMMADMKAQAAKVDALVTKMNAATGNAKVNAMAELLTALVSQHRTMRDGMMQMEDGMMKQMQSR